MFFQFYRINKKSLLKYMSRKILIMCFFSLIIGCQTNSNDIKWKKFDQSNLINESKENPNKRLQYKFIQPLFNKKIHGLRF